MNETNSNARITPCSSADDCQPHEVCVNLGSPLGCPSLIGGAYLDSSFDPIGPTAHYYAYFSGVNNDFIDDPISARQSVERSGSFRNLDVILTNPDSPGSDRTLTFTFERNQTPTELKCDFSGTGSGLDRNCTDTKHCVDVNAGDFIDLKAVDEPDHAAATHFKHTVEFNGCLCCDGQPPDENGNCRPVVQ